jgi:hypothetical protein
VSLPAADDLFRRTAPAPADPSVAPAESAAEPAPAPATDAAREDAAASAGPARRGRTPSGRVRHDEKMTVYVTADELLDLEHARLLLRRDHGLAVDRGRLVRTAIAIALADLDARGDDSVLVQRLSQ